MTPSRKSIEIAISVAPELQASIQRDCGLHYKRTQMHDKAVENFEKSLALKSDFRPVYELSDCKLKDCQPDAALESAKQCHELKPDNVAGHRQVVNCYHELNRLEETLKAAHISYLENPRVGKIKKDIVDLNLRSLAGAAAQPVLQKHMKYTKNKQHEQKVDSPNDFSEENGDVLQLSEEEKVIDDPPMLRHRKKCIEDMKHDIYFDETFSEQMKFWKKMQNDETLILNQTPKTSVEIKEIVDRIVKKLETHEQMLYVRDPFYVKEFDVEKKHLSKSRKIEFQREQRATLRTARWQFEQVKQLAKASLSRMLDFVESMLVDFYAVKAERTFPQKAEYFNKILDFVGMEYLRRVYTIHPKLLSYDIDERLAILFKTSLDKATEQTSKTDAQRFGETIDKMQKNKLFVDTAADKKSEFSRKFTHFSKRLVHSTDPVETAYLHYQLSEMYWRFEQYDDSQQSARNALESINHCDNDIWKFLCYFNIIRVYALKKNYSHVTENLAELTQVTSNLSEFCQVFAATATRAIDEINAYSAARRASRLFSKRSRLSSAFRTSSVTTSMAAPTEHSATGNQ